LSVSLCIFVRRFSVVSGSCLVAGSWLPAAGIQRRPKCAAVTLNYNYRDLSLLPTFPGLGIVLLISLLTPAMRKRVGVMLPEA
jgi:hypothetical protein